MQNQGISVNSAYNGVGLRKRVHYLTNSERYVRALGDAIQTYHNPDEIVEFLDYVARELDRLNQYADNRELLTGKFDEFLVSIEEIAQ